MNSIEDIAAGKTGVKNITIADIISMGFIKDGKVDKGQLLNFLLKASNVQEKNLIGLSDINGVDDGTWKLSCPVGIKSTVEQIDRVLEALKNS